MWITLFKGNSFVEFLRFLKSGAYKEEKCTKKFKGNSFVEKGNSFVVFFLNI